MSALLRFLGLRMGLGIALGVTFASLVVMTNTAHLHDLLAGDGQAYLALFMLYVMCALTFGSVAMGAAIMLLPWRETDPPPRDDRQKLRETDRYPPIH
jgi:hypothetical protein